MAKVPAGGKVAGYLLPFFLWFGAVDHLVPVFFSYGTADLMDDKADVVAGHPETLHRSLKVDACSEILEGDVQLQPWREGPPQVGIPLQQSGCQSCLQLMEHGRYHPQHVLEFPGVFIRKLDLEILKPAELLPASEPRSDPACPRTTSTSSSPLLLLLLALLGDCHVTRASQVECSKTQYPHFSSHCRRLELL